MLTNRFVINRIRNLMIYSLQEFSQSIPFSQSLVVASKVQHPIK